MKYLKSLESNIHLLFENKNPYKLTEEFALLSKARSGRYSPDNMSILKHLPSNYNLFYRKNRMFSIPQDFVSLKFQITPQSSSINTKIGVQAFSLILSQIWKRRLTLLSQYVSQFNGNIDIYFRQGFVTVQIYSPSLHF